MGKQGKKVQYLFEGDKNGVGTAWYPLYDGGFSEGIPNKRGKLSLPGGASAASYIGKFNQGEPIGKGRLVTLAKKKPFKGKFSSIPEIINRMFTMECDVGVTFPDKVEIEGTARKPEPRVYNLVGGGYYIGKIEKKSKSAKKGTAFLVQYNGNWTNGKWDGEGTLTYPGGYEIIGTFKNGKPFWVKGWQPSTGVITFDGSLVPKDSKTLPQAAQAAVQAHQAVQVQRFRAPTARPQMVVDASSPSLLMGKNTTVARWTSHPRGQLLHGVPQR